jgi:signal transduction histidine kinase
LDELGLTQALEDLCWNFRDLHRGGRASCDLDFNETLVAEELNIIIYRICQEALTNVTKHSSAEHVTLSLKHTGGDLRLMITDDGTGFNAEASVDSVGTTPGIGSESMKERCELFGGRFSIQSHPGKGTTVQAIWTLPKDGEL